MPSIWSRWRSFCKNGCKYGQNITFTGNVKEKEITKRVGRKEITERQHYIEKENATIIIYDQGKGMDFETILHALMEPATNYKKKEENTFSNDAPACNWCVVLSSRWKRKSA